MSFTPKERLDGSRTGSISTSFAEKVSPGYASKERYAF